ncbi:MAG TPA: DUF2842 domain-containing protein [Beijerinckiaceae bacterium]|nr:DUF2842 domain-containing protein [Beijerinckiaceae bacterium]
MPRRRRKLIGAAVMVSFVTVYALVAMVLAQARPVQDAPALLQTLIYAVLGLSWILPLLPLVKWMERPDPDGA